jgi:zinc transporter ZupT
MDPILFPTLVLFASAWLGGGVALLFSSRETGRSKFFLSFSGAFLFGLTLTHFFPSLFKGAGMDIGIWVLMGFLLQLLLDLLSGGIEHGHVQNSRIPHERLPYSLLIGLSLHAFVESIPLGVDLRGVGDELLLGLAVHKLPISLALAGLLMTSKGGWGRPLAAFSVFTLMAPIGVLLGHGIPRLLKELPQAFPHYLFAVVLGIILHVSTTILFESSEGHRFDRWKMLAVVSGFALAVFFAF